MTESADVQSGVADADADSQVQGTGTEEQRATPRIKSTTPRGYELDPSLIDNEHRIPKSRYDDMARRADQYEKQLKKIEREQSQREEEQAQKQGEWQQVADKRQKKIDTLSARVQELENQIVRDKRFRAWTQSANGIIRSDALGDAFDYITEDEWQTVNEEDENSVRMLAQGLAERKSFLAGGPLGAGSGGSSRPVMGLQSNREVQDNRTKTLSSGRQAWQFKKSKRHF